MIYDVVDTGLVLGRTYGGTNCISSPAPSGLKLTKSRNDKKLSDSSSNHSDADEPSLTLGLVAESNRRSGSAAVDRDQKSTHPSSPQSAASSLSNNFPTPNIKRETEVAGNDLQEGSAKKKLRLTKEQSTLLEGSFKEHSTLSPKQKLALAKELDLWPRQVEVWFQNRRARTKLKQTEIDFEFLKRYSESLKEENGRLQKEISQLRTMKLTPVGGGGGGGYSSQFNPTATPRMTLCPSCNTAGDSVHQDASVKCVVAQKPFLYNSNIAHHPSSRSHLT